jgi:hypothetical protein
VSNFHCLRATLIEDFFCFVFDDLLHVLHIFLCNEVGGGRYFRAEVFGTNRQREYRKEDCDNMITSIPQVIACRR